MPEGKTRVDFNAPSSLVERADLVSDLLDISRTRLLVEALEDEIDRLTSDERFRRKFREAYYDGRVDFDTVRSVLGTEEAMRARRLRESLDRAPPAPQVEGDLPSADEFYAEPVAEWTPDSESQDDERASDGAETNGDATDSATR
jgi:hypothetical protein